MSDPFLRIAVLYSPLTVAGGGERQMLEEVRWLRRLGHEVTALTFELSDDLLAEGIGGEAIEVLPGRGTLGRVLALRRALQRPFDVLVSHTSPELTWLATRGGRPPYLLYHNDIPFGAERPNFCAASRRYRRVFRAVRASVAGYSELEPPRLGLAWPRAELRTLLRHLALREARAVIVPSERSRRELRLLHGIEAAVVRGCLPSELVAGRLPVASGKELAPPGVAVVLSVCRLAPMKRVDLLIRAFARVRASAQGALLLVVGSGSERERLVALARSLGLEGAVRFAGYVPDDELSRYYGAADVFAAPILADFAIAPYEALARGCRVVWTTDLESNPALEASGHILVASPDEEAFAAAILDALRAPPAPPADLRSLTWESRNRRIAELCQDAARRDGRATRRHENIGVRDPLEEGTRP